MTLEKKAIGWSSPFVFFCKSTVANVVSNAKENMLKGEE